MLCTFTINPAEGTPEDRTCVIQSNDIKHIVDDERGDTWVRWLVGTEIFAEKILGTARENLERLQMEEFTNIERAHQVQKRIEGGYSIQPQPRGKPKP
jgi:hypothetical protein